MCIFVTFKDVMERTGRSVSWSKKELAIIRTAYRKKRILKNELDDWLQNSEFDAYRNRINDRYLERNKEAQKVA